MDVTASIENPQVYAGDKLNICVTFKPVHSHSHSPVPVLLSGYALVQGSFRLGDIILSEPFAIARKSGVVLTKHGFEYGHPKNQGGMFTGMLDGLRNLIINQPPTSPRRGRHSRTHSGSATTSVTSSAVNVTSSGDSSHQHANDDDGDYPIFATSQLLLFTDLKLESPQTFHIAVDLPASLPPSYRSRSLQISYQFVVGFERLDPLMKNKPTDTKLFLPFKLLPKPPTSADPEPTQFDLTKPINANAPVMLDNTGPNAIVATSLESSDSNPLSMDDFIDQLLGDPKDTEMNRKRRHSSSIMHLPGSQYSKVNYDISRNGIKIAQLMLSRPAINIGEVLAGQLIFYRPCLHVSVFLEMEESIDENYAALPSVSGTNSSTDACVYSIAFARQHQGTYGMRELPIYLPTLSGIAPRLDTKQIQAKWCLRLEIVCLTGSAFSEASDENEEFIAKSQIDHETFSCKIPIYMLPPSQVSAPISKTWKL